MRRRPFATLAVLSVLSIAVCLGVYLVWPIFLSWLDPVGHPRIPRDAFQGSDPRSAKILCSVNLADNLRFLPSPTVLTVLEVSRTDGAQERRAFLTRPDRSSIYFGPLQRQLGAAPVSTLFLDFGGAREHRPCRSRRDVLHWWVAGQCQQAEKRDRRLWW